MAEQSGSDNCGPANANGADWTVLTTLIRHHDQIMVRFRDQLRALGRTSPMDERGRRLLELGKDIPAALGCAIEGDWKVLRAVVRRLRGPVGEYGMDLRFLFDGTRALRAAAYPFLLRQGGDDEEAVTRLLSTFDALLAWVVCEVAGVSGMSQLDLERNALFLRSIVENIPYMIFVKDAEDLRFARFNKAGEELLGYRREELIGKNDYDFFPREEADFFTRKDREVLGGKEVVDIPEEPIETRAHGMRYLHTKKIPILDESGRPQFLLGISEDITERKRVAEELKQAKEAAEAASRAKSEFLARMSHEIRTPMNAVIGMTELALETRLDTEQREYLDIVRGSAESLLAVLNDVLDFSKIEAGKLELESVPFDLDDTVRQTVKAFVPRARDKRIDLDLEIASEVPWAVVGDAVRLRQVLVNLLDNAVRFTDRGGVETRVTLEESGERSVVVHFSVKDTGIGIARDRQESIFESFTQVDGSTTRRYGGTGLGLTISMRLVEMLGGRIWLESEPSKGSTFHFTARFELGDEGLEHLREEDAARAAARRIPPLSVLVAEDNLVNRTLIARILQKLGHRVVEARDGNEALKKLEHEDVDVVLMDLEMPHVGGIEVTQRIRERERATGGHLPIIALTAHARPEDRDRCLAAGMDGYVSKPIRRGVLFSTIAASLPEERLARGVPREAESGDGDEATEDLVSLFAETGAQDVRRIREALGIGDADGARQVAHSLAGAALVLHAEGVVRVARDLEAAAERGDLDGARSLCDALAREVERFGPS